MIKCRSKVPIDIIYIHSTLMGLKSEVTIENIQERCGRTFTEGNRARIEKIVRSVDHDNHFCFFLFLAISKIMTNVTYSNCVTGRKFLQKMSYEKQNFKNHPLKIHTFLSNTTTPEKISKSSRRLKKLILVSIWPGRPIRFPVKLVRSHYFREKFKNCLKIVFALHIKYQRFVLTIRRILTVHS